MFHSLNILPASFTRLIVWVVEFATIEEFRCRIGIIASTAGGDLFGELCVNLGIAYGFHHGEVFEIVVCLEKGVASEEFDKDASYAPDIAGE
jgi:hypothetical protein